MTGTVEKAVGIVVDTVTDYIDADSILVQRLAEHLVQRLSRAGLLVTHIGSNEGSNG